MKRIVVGNKEFEIFIDKKEPRSQSNVIVNILRDGFSRGEILHFSPAEMETLSKAFTECLEEIWQKEE